MTWDDYIFILKLRQIPTEAIESCKTFVLAEMQEWNMLNNFGLRTCSATHDLGYSELGSITSKEQSIQEIIEQIGNSILEIDSAGRDISKRLYKELVKKPHKGLERRVLKSFYLFHLDLNEEPTKENMWGNRYIWQLDTMYKLGAFK